MSLIPTFIIEPEKALESSDSRTFERFLCGKSWLLALGELGSATCGLQTVLLSFLHSGIAGHEAGSLQGRTVLGIQDNQSAGNAVTDSAGLAGNTAACNGLRLMPGGGCGPAGSLWGRALLLCKFWEPAHGCPPEATPSR